MRGQCDAIRWNKLCRLQDIECTLLMQIKLSCEDINMTLTLCIWQTSMTSEWKYKFVNRESILQYL